MFYTSLPVLALGIFDQDVDDRISLRYPLLYTPGHLDLLFNKIEFLKSVAHGIVSSFVLFFIPYGAFKNAVGPEGINLDGHQIFGTVVSTILVLVVTAQVCRALGIIVFIDLCLFFSPLRTDSSGHVLLDSVQPHSDLGIGSFLLRDDALH